MIVSLVTIYCCQAVYDDDFYHKRNVIVVHLQCLGQTMSDRFRLFDECQLQ